MKRGYAGSCLRFTRTAFYVLLSTAVLSCGVDRERDVVQDPTPQAMGSIGLALTGTARSGNVYRLRDGVFSIVGESTGYSTTVSTEDDPVPTIEVQVPADTYSVFLNPGYRLEHIEESGGNVSSYGRLAKRNPELRSGLFITPEGRIGLNGRQNERAPIPMEVVRLPAPIVGVGSGESTPPTATVDSTDPIEIANRCSMKTGTTSMGALVLATMK